MEAGHGRVRVLMGDGQVGQGIVTVVIDGGATTDLVSHETQIGASYSHTPALAG